MLFKGGITQLFDHRLRDHAQPSGIGGPVSENKAFRSGREADEPCGLRAGIRRIKQKPAVFRPAAFHSEQIVHRLYRGQPRYCGGGVQILLSEREQRIDGACPQRVDAFAPGNEGARRTSAPVAEHHRSGLRDQFRLTQQTGCAGIGDHLSIRKTERGRHENAALHIILRFHADRHRFDALRSRRVAQVHRLRTDTADQFRQRLSLESLIAFRHFQGVQIRQQKGRDFPYDAPELQPDRSDLIVGEHFSGSLERFLVAFSEKPPVFRRHRLRNRIKPVCQIRQSLQFRNKAFIACKILFSRKDVPDLFHVALQMCADLCHVIGHRMLPPLVFYGPHYIVTLPSLQPFRMTQHKTGIAPDGLPYRTGLCLFYAECAAPLPF